MRDCDSGTSSTYLLYLQRQRGGEERCSVLYSTIFLDTESRCFSKVDGLISKPPASSIGLTPRRRPLRRTRDRENKFRRRRRFRSLSQYTARPFATPPLSMTRRLTSPTDGSSLLMPMRKRGIRQSAFPVQREAQGLRWEERCVFRAGDLW